MFDDMTIEQAAAEAKVLGFKLTYDRGYGEYRLCPIGGTEAQAYYTADQADALDTARNWIGE